MAVSAITVANSISLPMVVKLAMNLLGILQAGDGAC
jgi:hypothetical protein